LKHLGFSDCPVTSNGIFSDPSIFAHTSTVIIHLILLHHDSFNLWKYMLCLRVDWKITHTDLY
jgi:hypothetical protein